MPRGARAPTTSACSSSEGRSEPVGRTVPLEWFDEPGPRAGSRGAEPADRGLRFSCTSCGNCCTGLEGYVLFTDEEGDAIARALGVSRAAFESAFTKQTELGTSLAERRTEHGLDCVFLDRDSRPGLALCGVYEARPAQCRTWPFWRSNLSSKQAWRRAAVGCPGIDRGPVYPPETIRERRDIVDM